SYVPDTGVTLLRPIGWHAPRITQVASRPAAPRITPPAPRPTVPSPATESLLYVQFVKTLAADSVKQIVAAGSGRLIDLNASNMAVIAVDSARTAAISQLYSDLPQVTCVAATAAPCGSPAAPVPATPEPSAAPIVAATY